MLQVKVPYHAQNPEFTLQVNAKTKDSEADFMNVLNYLLTPDKQLVYSDKGQAKQVRNTPPTYSTNPYPSISFLQIWAN